MNNFYNPYNPYSPYTNYGYPNLMQNQYQNPNQYQNQYQNQTTSQQPNSYVFVNGIEGAKAYQVNPNQTMMLLDSEEPIVYKKTSDQFGKSSIQFFRLVPTTEEELRQGNIIPSEDTTVLKKEVANLSDKINAIYSALEALNIKEGE